MNRDIYNLRRAADAVLRAEALLAAARERRDDWIITAALHGQPTSAIADATGLSGQTVRVLVRTHDEAHLAHDQVMGQVQEDR